MLDHVVVAAGVKHDWAAELSRQLLSLQKKGGYWQNDSGRWWEDLPTLDTSFAMIALSTCRQEQGRQAKASRSAPEESAEPDAAEKK